LFKCLNQGRRGTFTFIYKLLKKQKKPGNALKRWKIRNRSYVNTGKPTLLRKGIQISLSSLFSIRSSVRCFILFLSILFLLTTSLYNAPLCWNSSCPVSQCFFGLHLWFLSTKPTFLRHPPKHPGFFCLTLLS